MSKSLPKRSDPNQAATKQPNPRKALSEQAFAAVFGGFLCLALLKFGNPPIMEKWVTTPTNGWEFVLNCPWPIRWGYALLALTLVSGLPVWRWSRTRPPWFLWLPLVWLGWQFLSATQTLDGRLTEPTLWHFTACIVCFYLGFFALGSAQ